jgi:hypothetical protein
MAPVSESSCSTFSVVLLNISVNWYRARKVNWEEDLE